MAALYQALGTETPSPAGDPILERTSAKCDAAAPRGLPLQGEAPAGLVDLLDPATCWERPTGPVTVTFDEWMRWSAECWEWAAACLEEHDAKQSLIEFAHRRGEKIRQCCREWQVLTCEHDHRVQWRPQDPCGSEGCPHCAVRKRRHWARAVEHYVKVNPPKAWMNYFAHTFTMPTSDHVSAAQFQSDFKMLTKAVRQVCDKVFTDGGVVVRFEIGFHGHPHGHALRHGGFAKTETIRSVYNRWIPGARHLDEALWRASDKSPQQGKRRVIDQARYMAKGATKAIPRSGFRNDSQSGDFDEDKHEFVHPLVVVLWELALHKRNRIRCYGSMVGLQKEARRARNEADLEHIYSERDVDELNQRVRHGPKECPKCGRRTYWDLVKRETAAIPSDLVPQIFLRAPPQPSCRFGRPDGGRSPATTCS